MIRIRLRHVVGAALLLAASGGAVAAVAQVKESDNPCKGMIYCTDFGEYCVSSDIDACNMECVSPTVAT